MNIAAHTDIDIDLRDRTELLRLVKHVPASRHEGNDLVLHQNGVYFHNVPVDPMTGFCSIPYKEAEEAGFFKIDFLNVSIYNGVKNEQHLNELMDREPVWELLHDEDFVVTQKIWQLHNHANVLKIMKPRCVEELAMVIALIRPGKHYLIGKSWSDIRKEIWKETKDFRFKKSHSVCYALAIVVQLNLIVETLMASGD